MSAILGAAVGALTKATGVLGAIQGVTSIFGGNEGPNINLARKFSAECGFVNPVTNEIASSALTAAKGDRAMACRIIRDANAPFQAAPVPAPVAPPTVMSGGAPAPVSVLHTPARGPLAGTGTAFGGPQMSLISTSAGAGAIPTAISVARQGAQLIGNVWRTSTGKISAFQVGARKISRKNVVKMAKEAGIAAAAGAVGASAVDVAQAVLDESTTRRRRRGITSRDLANARRVNCKIARYARDLGIKPAVRRRTSCRS